MLQSGGDGLSHLTGYLVDVANLGGEGSAGARDPGGLIA